MESDLYSLTGDRSTNDGVYGPRFVYGVDSDKVSVDTISNPNVDPECWLHNHTTLSHRSIGISRHALSWRHGCEWLLYESGYMTTAAIYPLQGV